MSSLFIGCVVIAIIWALAYHRVPLLVWSGGIVGLLLLYTFFGHAARWVVIADWIIILAILLPLNIKLLRRHFISKPIFYWYQRIVPKMSHTEKEALEAGTTSFEAELFNGKPNWQMLLRMPSAQLTSEEQAFIDGPVEQLCSMINDWQITHVDADMSPEIWEFLKSQGFFALIIPKRYGGKAFSAFAHSEILVKVYGVSITVATTIGVPNSLGPAELLLHYGTEEQKNYYLPRLARGEEIPCFALTGPEAGSDASSIPDTGIVCRGIFNSKEILGIRLNWDKRYITLAPVATVLGLAFKLFDPDHLLSNEINRGITCALIPVNAPGITIGRRHFPLNTAFQNGPTQGKDVFIPLDWIIGGPKMAGQGWRMLVECLSAGRAISLPASGIGGAKMAALTTGAYARIRKQFNLPIGRFEGVAEALTRIAGHLYAIDAARQLTMAIIDQGARPSVLSAIMKYHATEISRQISSDAMDVHGGKGICLGPHNYLGRFFQSSPIGITVEGANILTRSLIIFGQGAIRCHRYVLTEMKAAQESNPKIALASFDQALFGHLGLVISNIFRTLFLGLTNGRLVKAPVSSPGVGRYYQLLTRCSAAFALLADAAMLVLGAELKRKERLSARLGDILSYMYIIAATLKRYEDEGKQLADVVLVHWACQHGFFIIQQQFDAVLQNFPNKWFGRLLRFLILPWGQCFKAPDDRLSKQVAEILLNPAVVRDRLTQGAYKGNLVGANEEALRLTIEAEPIDAKIHKAIRDGVLTAGLDRQQLLSNAKEANIISEEEFQQLLRVQTAVRRVIAVDDFDPSELMHH